MGKQRQILKWLTCDKKRAYKDKEGAEGALVNLVLREGPSKSQGLHTYKCPYCGKFHVGHGGGL